MGSYLLERIAKIKTKVEIASEFRYKNPILYKDELFIVISQSGETADTLEALKLAKNNQTKEIENFARNVCQEKGVDYDSEFNRFKNTLGIT